MFLGHWHNFHEVHWIRNLRAFWKQKKIMEKIYWWCSRTKDFNNTIGILQKSLTKTSMMDIIWALALMCTLVCVLYRAHWRGYFLSWYDVKCDQKSFRIYLLCKTFLVISRCFVNFAFITQDYQKWDATHNQE